MAALSGTQKRWIVEHLACYEGHSEVAEGFKERFGAEVSLQQVYNYDASKVHSRERMAKELVAFFDATRERFRADTESIAIAQKAVRLRRLDRMAEKAEKMRNYPLAASLLEQAAKEVGEAYTNRRVIEGNPEKPLEINNHRDELKGLTPQEIVNLYRDSIRAGHAGI